MISKDRIFSILSEQLPSFCPVNDLQPLEGGNLNHVWRIKGQENSLIIKWAPAHITNNPEVPLSPKRLHFEAQALELFTEGELLETLGSDKVRPPRRLHFDRRYHLLIMEDVGSLPTLSEWIHLKDHTEVGKTLGCFIGQLHKLTVNNEILDKQFNNTDIQQTRLKVQYNPAADYLSKTGLDKAISNQVSQKTKTLGQKLLEPGRCLVMGDLWLPSVLVNEGRLRIIDWEFVHYGRPLQDVGHFAAHCWMQAHSSSSKERYELFKKLWGNFWNQYQQTLDDTGKLLLSGDEMQNMATHAGAEILVRTVGPFQDDYVYETLSPAHPKIQEATRKAKDLILSAQLSALWS